MNLFMTPYKNNSNINPPRTANYSICFQSILYHNLFTKASLIVKIFLVVCKQNYLKKNSIEKYQIRKIKPVRNEAIYQLYKSSKSRSHYIAKQTRTFLKSLYSLNTQYFLLHNLFIFATKMKNLCLHVLLLKRIRDFGYGCVQQGEFSLTTSVNNLVKTLVSIFSFSANFQHYCPAVSLHCSTLH